MENENIKDMPEAEDMPREEEEIEKIEEAAEKTSKKAAKEKKKKEHDDAARIIKLEDDNARLEKEKAELEDRYLRLVAEYDNFKKRTQKEKDELSVFTKGAMLRELLPVFDNLDRAAGVTDPEKLSEGVEMILKSFGETLTKLGITEIKAKGEPFDANLHEAIFHEECEGEPENTVSEVFQKGYILGDKVIRHAMVKVVN